MSTRSGEIHAAQATEWDVSAAITYGGNPIEGKRVTYSNNIRTRQITLS